MPFSEYSIYDLLPDLVTSLSDEQKNLIVKYFKLHEEHAENTAEELYQERDNPDAGDCYSSRAAMMREMTREIQIGIPE